MDRSNPRKDLDQIVKQILLRHPLRVGVASAVLAGGVLGGAVAFADTSQPQAAPSSPAAQGGQPARQRHPRVIGKVTNVSSTGGLANQGTITVAEPDGHQTTFSLTSSTKAWKYQGQGQKPVKESAASIATNEVIQAGLRNQQGGVVARRILDSGFKAS
jgi:hypothetical protein